MQSTAVLDRQVRQTLADLGAFDATCPGCGRGFAFLTAPRLRGLLSPGPGRRQDVTALLPCTHCSYVAEHTVAVDWPSPEIANAA